jgi:division protein CdvB (Snf7/Vps24/ESCRT-III family)
MSWIRKIFKSKKPVDNEHISREEDILVKLEASISNCTAEIKKAGDENDQIRNWAIEAIRDSFDVPQRFWYEEFEKYKEIRSLEENKSIDRLVLEKCDEVVQGYLDEIELRKAKIQLYEGLIQKYQASKAKMLLIKKKKDDETMAQSKLQALEKHSKRIEQMREDPENLPSHVEETTHLELMNEEINEVYTEYEISEEVRNCLVEINQQFKSTSNSMSSKAAIEEVKFLLSKISKE